MILVALVTVSSHELDYFVLKHEHSVVASSCSSCEVKLTQE